ncbi:MAG TPA: hypothetical protein VGE64_03785 [Xanthomonadaceae bacterium]
MKAIFAAAAILLVACSSPSDQGVVPAVAASVAMNEQQSAGVEKVLRACPGIVEYLPDTQITDFYTFEGVDHYVFKVPRPAPKVPGEYLAEGHTCTVSVRGGDAAIAKRPCVSICRMHKVDEPHPPQSMEYPLN